MQQIPCKMTDSSSKLLQIRGKWYQERKPKKNPRTILNPKKWVSKGVSQLDGISPMTSQNPPRMALNPWIDRCIFAEDVAVPNMCNFPWVP